MKVFISSLIRDFRQYRDAAERGARTLRHEVVRAEDFGASPESPQRVCLQGVRDSEVTLLLLGASYGQPQGSELLSPTHEEYREARQRGEVLVFIQKNVTPEPAQEQFIAEVRKWASGHYAESFGSPEELEQLVTRALHDLELAKKQGPIDEAEMLERARALVPSEDRHSASSSLCVVVAGSPRQQILRPAQLESQALSEQIIQAGLFGPHRVFDSGEGTQRKVKNDALVLYQEHASVLLTPLGEIRVIQPSMRARGRDYLSALVEEEIEESIALGLQFCAWLLDHVDPNHRLRSLAPLAAVTGAQYVGWLKKAERRSGGGVSIGMGRPDGPAIAELNPAAKQRAALRIEATALAEDLTVLLRRIIKQ